MLITICARNLNYVAPNVLSQMHVVDVNPQYVVSVEWARASDEPGQSFSLWHVTMSSGVVFEVETLEREKLLAWANKQ